MKRFVALWRETYRSPAGKQTKFSPVEKLGRSAGLRPASYGQDTHHAVPEAGAPVAEPLHGSFRDLDGSLLSFNQIHHRVDASRRASGRDFSRSLMLGAQIPTTPNIFSAVGVEDYELHLLVGFAQ